MKVVSGDSSYLSYNPCTILEQVEPLRRIRASSMQTVRLCCSDGKSRTGAECIDTHHAVSELSSGLLLSAALERGHVNQMETKDPVHCVKAE